MNWVIYSKLLDVASAQGLVPYGDVALLAGFNMQTPPDRKALSLLLDEINEHEATRQRPMLSSVVVHANAPRTPGPGFFKGARNIGRLTSTDKIDELAFWAQEVKRVHQYWVRHPKPSIPN